MATLFIDLLIKPRKRFRLKTTSQDDLIQQLVRYVQHHYIRQTGWELYKYGRSWGNLCHVVPSPFVAWLETHKDNPRAVEIVDSCKVYLRSEEGAVDPSIAVYIPLSWLCITIPPMNEALREHWQTRIGTVLSDPMPVSVPTLKPSDYYLLCEGRAIPNVWQHHFELCMRNSMPFIVLWHFPPKQARFVTRYDILFSWEPLVKSHQHVFESPEYPDIAKIITKRITQLLKERRHLDGFKRVTLQNVLGEGQINILKLSFEAAEQLTIDLVKMMQMMIDEIELKLKKKTIGMP
ncbi:hypothetical protein QZP90_26170 [Serratia marcescens]|jgi:hypothetical protein|uniref:hypothetical protein n=1 Tax=Serratia TaxID=613 RepID=UPI000F8D3A66|nr:MULTISPECIES: hypothetical protein [Serratia]MBH3245106.1 hypothetical protein [Serratia marcescens]MBN5413911.1 hypothetical protein [Serratia marcescens]MDP8737006.1 hypothetical protein [Serratia marcescens]MDU4176741.1 hypothetical protein [Serratia liquefaciens]QDI35758.1 hypothetical protein FG170_25935 [Serratia marcescens]